MNKEQMAEGIGYIDEELLKETDEARKQWSENETPRVRNITFRSISKYLVSAAAVVLVIGAGIITFRNLNTKSGSMQAESSSEYTKNSIVRFNDASYDAEVNMTVSAAPEEAALENSLFDDSLGNDGVDYFSAPSSAECKEIPTITNTDNIQGITTAIAHSADQKSATVSLYLEKNVDYSLEFGLDWWVEEFSNNQWVTVDATSELVFDSLMVRMTAGDTYSDKVSFEAYPNLAKGGKTQYRIVRPVRVCYDDSSKDYYTYIYFKFKLL